jgi:hypothetical protein
VNAVVPAQRAAIKRRMHRQQIFNKARVCDRWRRIFMEGKLRPGTSSPDLFGQRPALNLLGKIESGTL